MLRMKHVYFDHAATTPLDKDVLEKMLPYFCEEYGNADSPHAVGRRAIAKVDEARDRIASLLHAQSDEIYFTAGGTEADNWAIFNGAYAKKAEGRNRVVVSSIEHHAVLSAAKRLEKQGFEVEYLPVNAQGIVEEDALEKYVNENTALVALMAANNETGALQPVDFACKVAHQNGALFFTDCVQAVAYLPIDVQKIKVDMLSFSAHKIYGPKGVGVLYVRNKTKITPLISGGEQERGMRGGTTNVPGVVGMAKAFENATREQAENNEKLKKLRALFIDEISSIPGVHYNTPLENAVPSVVNVRFDDVENTAFLYNMDLRGFCVSAGSACASASIKPSHVLTAMGLTDKQAKESVRFSFGKNNTEEEIRLGVKAVKEIVEKIRQKK